MHCAHCRSLMNETQVESDSLSKQVWYECSVCGRVKCVSEPTLEAAQPFRLHPQKPASKRLGRLPR